MQCQLSGKAPDRMLRVLASMLMTAAMSESTSVLFQASSVAGYLAMMMHSGRSTSGFAGSCRHISLVIKGMLGCSSLHSVHGTFDARSGLFTENKEERWKGRRVFRGVLQSLLTSSPDRKCRRDWLWPDQPSCTNYQQERLLSATGTLHLLWRLLSMVPRLLLHDRAFAPKAVCLQGVCTSIIF